MPQLRLCSESGNLVNRLCARLPVHRITKHLPAFSQGAALPPGRRSVHHGVGGFLFELTDQVKGVEGSLQNGSLTHAGMLNVT